MSSEAKPSLTPEQYLALDTDAERPSEYLNGITIEVEAASRRHNAILANLVYLFTDVILKSKLPCQTYSQQMRVFSPRAGLYAYPDVVVTCGPEEYGPHETLLNPVLLLEVLSPSTENYDTGKKFEYYRSIESLQTYITVAQDEARITVWNVLNNKWTLETTHVGLDQSLSFQHHKIALRYIYRGIDFAAQSPTAN